MRKESLLIILAVVLILAVSACSGGINKAVNEGKAEGDRLKIYATFYPMYYIADEIAKDKGEVIQMIPPGVEPHDWEPTLKTMAELKDSDLFIYNGAGMERWAEKIIKNLEEDKVKVVEASKGIELSKGEGGHDEDYDPHVWVSPVNLIAEAKNVLDALIEIDDANKEYYDANYKELVGKLNKLHKDILESSEDFKIKTIVTSHEAFGYFAKEYGITQIPIRGISPEQEPSPAKLVEIVKLCKENNIKYVFVEKFVNPKFSKVIAGEIDGDVLTLNAAHGLSEEEMAEGQDYITLMYDNLNNLEKALK